jgi:putative hydrolase of the HAD superfamily
MITTGTPASGQAGSVERAVDLYLFDFDKTLYAYNSQLRLPALARASGVSQYRLASSWWAAGFELRAETGEWPDADGYLDEFARVTGGRRLTLEEWAECRLAAMTPNPRVIATLARVKQSATVSLLSNNPAPFAAALPRLAPDVAELLDGNVLISCALGVRKPDPAIYSAAIERYGARADETLLIDDKAENVEGALAAGLHAHHYTTDASLAEAVAAFESRQR